MRERIAQLARGALDASRRVRSDFDASTARSLHMAVASGSYNAVLGLGKIVSGAIGLSVFACVNGLYTVCMGVARLSTARGAAQGGAASSRRHAHVAGVMLTSASVLYMMYAGWTYFHPASSYYPKPVALAIATFTFVEIALNIKSLVQTRGSTSAVVKAIRIIGMASSIITLALTQEAILSFQGAGHDPAVNAYIRCLTGLAAAILGAYVIVRTRPGAPETNGWR